MEKYNQDFNITINPCTGIAFNLGLKRKKCAILFLSYEDNVSCSEDDPDGLKKVFLLLCFEFWRRRRLLGHFFKMP